MKYCLGTVQFGMNYGIQGNGQPQQEKTNQMLSYAVDHGIRHFDTASAYGEAENVLGNFIREYPKLGSKMKLVSKLHPDAFGSLPEEKWGDIAEKNAESSLCCLGISKFEAYLFHNASYIFNSAAVSAITSVVDKGLANTVGVSIYTPEEAMRALEYPQIGTIQIPYNVFDRRLDKCGFFEKAKENGVAVYARSSLLQGLAVMDPENLPDRVKFAHDYLCDFLKICREFGVNPLNAAIGYAAEKKEIDYIVFGVDNLTQLKEYISMQNQKISPEMIAQIDKTFENVEERLVNPVLWK